MLGKTLVIRTDAGVRLSRIVETEAYLGESDRACHTFGGRRTKRTETMYRGGGLAYVYFIYGMHFCLNAVTGGEGSGEAVLIRATEPLGEDCLPILLPKRDRKTNGPGKLCKFYSVTREDDGAPLYLSRSRVSIADAVTLGPRKKVVRAPRVGIDSSGEARDLPLRFYIARNPYVSKTS